MSPFQIRPIRPDDDPAMARIIREVMTEFGAVGRGFSIEDPEVGAMSEAYAGERSAYFVLLDEGEIVGGSGIAPLEGAPDDLCELRKMYYLPRARGRGQGRPMLELCLATARRRGFTRCYLETLGSMAGARRLYEKFGFRPLPAPEGSTGHFGCDAWYMLELEDSPSRRPT